MDTQKWQIWKCEKGDGDEHSMFGNFVSRRNTGRFAISKMMFCELSISAITKTKSTREYPCFFIVRLKIQTHQ